MATFNSWLYTVFWLTAEQKYLIQYIFTYLHIISYKKYNYKSGKETTKIDLFDDSFTLKVVKEIIKDDKMKLNTHTHTHKKTKKKIQKN